MINQRKTIVNSWVRCLENNQLVMYRSNRSFNMSSPGIPRAFDTFAVPGRREFDYQSLPGGGEFELHPRFHVKSLAW